MAKNKKQNQSSNTNTTSINIEYANSNFSSIVSEKKIYKIAFWASLLIMLLTLWVSGYNSGVGTDEMDMNIYGKANISYYTSGFKDTTFLQPDHHDGVTLPLTLRYYGSAFEYFASPLTYIIGDTYEYNTRHLINQLIAILGLMFTGLIAKKIIGYKASILAIWAIFLTPIFSGLAVFNTKDIPFLTAYIAVIYFAISFVEQMPKPNKKTWIALILSIWFLLSIRIGGLLLISFLFLYILLKAMAQIENKAAYRKNIFSKCIAAISFSLALTILTWPYVLQAPFTNLINSINVVKNFPQKISLPFNGEYIDSLSLPISYLPKMMVITIPIVVLAMLLLGLIALVSYFKNYTKFKHELILLSLASLIPLSYAIYSHMPLYNSWRHVMFIYPPLVILASVGITAICNQFLPTKFEFLPYLILILGLTKPILYWYNNNPYQYTYYNTLAGDNDRTFIDYESDYWQITVKDAIDWLIKNEHLDNSKDSINIITNAYTFSNYYTKKMYPNVKIKWTRLGEKSRFGSDGTYSIFSNLFLEPSYLEYCFPSPYTIHTVNINNKPITYIAKDSLKYSYKAYLAFNNGDFKAADSFFSMYMQQIKYDGSPKNLTQIFGAIAYSKIMTNDFKGGVSIAQKTLLAYPNDFFANMALGIYYYNTQDKQNAIKFFTAAQNARPNDPSPQTYLKLIIGS